MQHRTRSTLIYAGIALATGAMLACNGTGGPPVPPQGNGQQVPPAPGYKYTCEIRLKAPTADRKFKGQGMNKAASAIVVISEAYCNTPPNTHVVTLRLTKFIKSGGWEPVTAFDGSPERNCAELPPPNTNPKPATCIQPAPCQESGRYRTEALVTGNATNPEDGTNVDYTQPIPPSDEVKITC